MCNGMLAGLVAITAPCAFVSTWAACAIGGIAGIIVIWSALFWEKIIKVDDPVGAVSVHGVNGAWGVLALGIFADGSYGIATNNVHLYKEAASGAINRLDASQAILTVHVPADAELSVQGKPVKKTSDDLRNFWSPPIDAGTRYEYLFKATWKDGDKTVSHSEYAVVNPGDKTEVDLRGARDMAPDKPDSTATKPGPELKEMTDAKETGVTGWMYGNPSQFHAEAVGVAANILWVFPTSLLFFGLYGLVIGNRVKREVEVQGLDIHEMGVAGYIDDDPKTPEGHLSGAVLREPRPATSANGHGRFVVTVQGADDETVTSAWSELCQPSPTPPSKDFLVVYPHMTTFSGTRFRFRGGDPKQVSASLERLLQSRIGGKGVHTAVEP
jgi:uncharacterized protein (TIGR03000 family)